VEISRGDVKRRADLERAVMGADYVINLAHGGGGANFEAIRAAMVDSAKDVADVCQAAHVKRLVHVGSISGLYLGDASSVITGSTPTDPRPDTRNDYSHAKALADAAVLQTHKQAGLPVVLLRPGLVIGSGTSPFHGGLGFFNNDQYCVGWNAGTNALPWVLVDDCAEAIVAALTAPDAVGKAYNLVGDICPSARQYLQDLSKVLGRPLHFVPSSPTGLWLTEMGKWAIKRVAGQKVKRPFKRDILSRGLSAQFDCTDAKRDLGWKPVADTAEFHRRALAVHAED
jgi:nucleoside-diphosphate-sugar epimerase